MPRPRRRRPPAAEAAPRPPLEPREGHTAIGIVGRPHGIRGEVRVDAFAPSAPNLQPGRRVFIDGFPYEIDALRPARGVWLVALSGLTSRNAAEELRGALIEIPDEEVERETPDSYFLHELIGLRVETGAGELLGTIAEVLQPGANDVYVVRGPRGEILVPAIRDVVTSIDIAGGLVRIDPPPGLLAD
jgi:16S rRNA processing protein RimM